jgi:Uma2 family endonuclease
MSEAAYKIDRHYEILNGVQIYMMASPTTAHNFIAGNIYNLFYNFLKGKTCKTLMAPTDVWFSDDDLTIPDVLIVCDRSKIQGKRIQGAPDLIVEVLSPSTAKNDLSYKKDLYEKHGVKEYWLVDPRTREIVRYILRDGRYALEGVYTRYSREELDSLTDDDRKAVAGSFRVSFFEDLMIDVEDVFFDVF